MSRPIGVRSTRGPFSIRWRGACVLAAVTGLSAPVVWAGPESEPRLALRFRASRAAPLVPVVHREVQRIWGSYGVSVDRDPGVQPGDAGEPWVLVMLVDDAASGTGFREGLPLASLHVSAARRLVGTPVATIVAHVGHVRALSRLAVPRSQGTWSDVPEALVARAAGRAIAHEIGHLLLGPGHDRTGLMEATFTVRHVLATDLAPFALAPRAIAIAAARARTAWQGDVAVALSAPPLKGR